MPQRGNPFAEKSLYLVLPQKGQPVKITFCISDPYTQLYIQQVFAVKGRNNFMQYAWEEEIYKYITAIEQNDKHKMLAINGMPDHITGKQVAPLGQIPSFTLYLQTGYAAGINVFE